MRPIRPQLLIATLLALLSIPLLILQMYFLALISNSLIQLNQPEPLLWYGFGGAFLIRLILLSSKDFIAQGASRNLRQQLRNQIWQGLSLLGPAKLKYGSDGQLSSLLTEHIDALDGYICRYWPQQFLVLVAPLTIAIVVSQHSLLASALLLCTAPLVPLFMILVGKEASKASTKQLQVQSRMSGRLYDFLLGLNILKRLNASHVAEAHLANAAEGYQRSTMQVLKLAFLSTAVLELFSSLAIALVALYLGLGLLGELPWLKQVVPVDYASALFILLLAPEFYQPLRQLGNDYHAKAQAQSASLLLAPLWRAISEAESRQQSSDLATHDLPEKLLQAKQFSLTLSHIVVGQTQTPRLALEQLNIPAQSRLLITGPSGSGKSTLLQLFAGFLPFQGNLTVNEIDISASQMPRLRQHIAYLNQHAELMPGSIADNLQLAKRNATETEMIQALTSVGLWTWLATTQQGLDYPIGESGLGLSGGQQQRLALARLLLQPKAIWLLDEPFAELDQQSVQPLCEVLAEISRGKTLLIASHQWQHLHFLDACIYLSEGKMTHSDELSPLPSSCHIQEPTP
ncbi:MULTISPECIES: thiol reductant ABC exporter subunit CydD [unclassified Agarivorans]|uniref:thiol reductant ABC exporter subunit CydD n=1 Tax=unclassified Agarivorans TaxID=2636026 RepID=UPI003D7D4C3B